MNYHALCFVDMPFALADYIDNGKKDGLGFVNATCYLTRATYEFEGSYLGSFLGPNDLTTKSLKENEEEPPEPEWIKEYTENYLVVERYP
jgi:hypothetical protein